MKSGGLAGMVGFKTMHGCLQTSCEAKLVHSQGLWCQQVAAVMQIRWGVSSLHMTFNTEQEWEVLAKAGFLKRNGDPISLAKQWLHHL